MEAGLLPQRQPSRRLWPASGAAVAFHEIAVSLAALSRSGDVLTFEPPAGAPINADAEPLDCGSLSEW